MLHWTIKTLFILLLITAHTATSANTLDDELDAALGAMVAKLQSEKGLVSLGAMITKDNKAIAAAVSGERKIDSQVPVSLADKWHLGSVTKSITATMIARLVEQEVLQWHTTVGDVFKGSEVNAAWRNASLSMLLTNTGGAKTDFPWRIQKLHPAEGAERQALRKQEVLKILQEKPEYKPGSGFAYSNVGYTIAGVMAEVTTGKSWENLVREQVFQPLGLTSAGFGPPTDMGDTLEQPRGHEDTWFSGPVAVSTDTDNSPIMGPAGSIHMSLQDLSTYGNEHLLGSRGKGKLLQQATYNTLHTMGSADYAYGWIAAQKTAWANDHAVLYHNGSNTYWYALLVLVPELQLSIAVTTNDGDLNAASESAWRIVREMGATVLANKEK